MEKKSLSIMGLSAVSALLTSGCAYLEPQRVSADFRSSANNMVLGQLADPDGAVNASGGLVDGLDGQQAVRSLRTYRGDTAGRDFGDVSANSASVVSGGN